MSNAGVRRYEAGESAAIRAKLNYSLMLVAHYSIVNVEDCALQVINLVNEGYTTWKDLGFTEQDVRSRLALRRGVAT